MPLKQVEEGRRVGSTLRLKTMGPSVKEGVARGFVGLNLTLSLMPPYATLNTPAHRQQYAGFSRWPCRKRPICGAHVDPTQNLPPAAGHCTLDPENACDHAPLIRFARRPLLGGDTCAAREWSLSSFLRSSTVMYALAPRLGPGVRACSTPPHPPAPRLRGAGALRRRQVCAQWAGTPAARGPLCGWEHGTSAIYIFNMLHEITKCPSAQHKCA